MSEATYPVVAAISTTEAGELLESRRIALQDIEIEYGKACARIVELSDQNGQLRETLRDIDESNEYKAETITVLSREVLDLRGDIAAMVADKQDIAARIADERLIERSLVRGQVARGLVEDEFLRVKNAQTYRFAAPIEGLNKIRVIKAVRAALAVNLKEAKDLVDHEWDYAEVKRSDEVDAALVEALASNPFVVTDDDDE